MSDIDTITFRVEAIVECGPYSLLSLKSDEPYPQRPGQYCIVNYQLGDKHFTRPYSIASAPREDGLIELCVLGTGDPDTSAAIKNLEVGSSLEISPAGGRFETPRHDHEAVFIAGGSGITPLRSMILWRIEHSSAKTILLYGCKKPTEIPYKESFNQLKDKNPHFEVRYFVDDELEDGCQPGPVTNGLEGQTPPLASYFLCGPPGMIEACKQQLQAEKIPTENIHTDRY